MSSERNGLSESWGEHMDLTDAVAGPDTWGKITRLFGQDVRQRIVRHSLNLALVAGGDWTEAKTHCRLRYYERTNKLVFMLRFDGVGHDGLHTFWCINDCDEETLERVSKSCRQQRRIRAAVARATPSDGAAQ